MFFVILLKVPSVRKDHVASPNESGPTTIIELFKTWIQQLEQINRHIDRRGKYLNRMDNHIEYL